jgi:geranylgeranyl reductase family protein
VNQTLADRANVAIIGAGPAGSALAARLAAIGVDRVVLADRHDFPRDKTCGSGISPKGIGVLKELGVWQDVLPHAYFIRGLRLVTPGDEEAFVSGGDSATAVVCRRRELDGILLDHARRGGVTFVPNVQARSLLWDGDRVAGFAAADGREFRARITVVADGAHSRLTPDPRPRRLLQAIMGWWEGVRFTPAHLEMVFDRMLSPHYGWLFPESEGRVNIGICFDQANVRENARTLFERFLGKHYASRLDGARPIGRFLGHPISYTYRVGPLSSPGRLVIGEAGRMTHPATGEGIYQGMRSALLAATALRDALEEPRREKAAFRRYEWACRRAFEPSFGFALAWHRVVRSPALDWILRANRKAQRSPLIQRAVGTVISRM